MKAKILNRILRPKKDSGGIKVFGFKTAGPHPPTSLLRCTSIDAQEERTEGCMSPSALPHECDLELLWLCNPPPHKESRVGHAHGTVSWGLGVQFRTPPSRLG